MPTITRSRRSTRLEQKGVIRIGEVHGRLRRHLVNDP